MFDHDKWMEIWVTITRNKTRSLLTCFGVFWGILMLVVLLGAGNGLQNSMSLAVKGFASNSLFYYTDRTSEAYKGFNKGRSWNMRNRDIEAILSNVEGIEAVSPVLFGAGGEKNIVYKSLSGTFKVKGIAPEYFLIEGQEIIYGRLLNKVDEQTKRKVCVIGSKINDVLFKGDDSCGKYIRINGLHYQIVGVSKQLATGMNMGGRAEETAFLPFSTMQHTLNQGDIIHLLCVLGARGYDINKTEKEVETIIKRQNQIAPSDPQALTVVNAAKQFGVFELLFVGIDTLVWLVGMGTLLAGIIGISNIMMVTVKERTREIGVRRALGAKPFDIISQVMSESLVLTALAGLLGLTAGVFLLDVVNKILLANPTENPAIVDPSVDIQTALTATVILLLCGLLAGLIPAWRALQIKAIDAIRDE